MKVDLVDGDGVVFWDEDDEGDVDVDDEGVSCRRGSRGANGEKELTAASLGDEEERFTGGEVEVAFLASTDPTGLSPPSRVPANPLSTSPEAKTASSLGR
jgi:hypothetical protein